MVAFVTGAGSTNLGLAATSLATIGKDGVAGDPTLGRDAEQVYLNVATGNLVVQQQDEFVASQDFGQPLSLLRTYNSYGSVQTDDNKDGWQMSAVKTLSNIVTNSVVTRNDGDGTSLVYNYDSSQQLYVCKTGAGAFDTLKSNANGSWTWRNGTTGETETYATTNAPSDTTLRMTASADREGKATAYAYAVYDGTNSRLASITNAAGQAVQLAYDDAHGHPLNIATLTTTGTNDSSTVNYTYDANNKLSTVTFTKNGQSFTTTYTYDNDKLNGGTQTGKLRAIQFADGSKLSFLYDNTNIGSARVKTITQTMADGSTRITQIKFASNNAQVTDPLGNITTLNYDSSKRLTSIVYPSTLTGQPKVTFAYDTNGQLKTQTDALNNVVEYFYDTAGRQIEQHSGTALTNGVLNGTGNTITRTYDSTTGVLTSETVYLTPDPDGDAGSQTEKNGLTTTYVYNANAQANGNLPAKTLVHFVVSPQGRVTEYQYDGNGRRATEIEYGDRMYSGSLDEASLNTWAAAADRTQSVLTRTTYAPFSNMSPLFGDLEKDVTRYATVDANGTGVANGTESVTEFIYDPFGRLLFTIDGNHRGTLPTGDVNTTGATHYTYDELGRVLSQCDATGKVTSYTYDDVGNKTTVAYANGLTTVTTYDATNQPLSIANSGTALGTTRNWYDADGQLRMTQDSTGLKSYMLYDEAHRKIADIDPNGSLTEYTYNIDNLVVAADTYATNLTSAQLATLVDANGNPTSVALSTLRPAVNANDRKTWNFYDADGRLASQVDELGFVTDTQYDGASRVTKTIRWSNATTTSITTTTKRSDLVIAANSAADQTTQFFYEIPEQNGTYSVTVAPDGVFTQKEYDAAGHLRHTVTFYSKQGSVSLNGTTGLLEPHLPSADGVNDSHTWYFYDAQDRVSATVDADGNLTQFSYDNSGNKSYEILHTSTSIAPPTITLQTRLADLLPQAPGTQQTQYKYTDLNQLYQRIDPDGTVTQYAYDAAGNLTQTDRALGTSDQRTVMVKVDGFGRVTNELSAVGAAAIATIGVAAAWAQYQTTYTYDTEGRKTTMVDANGLKTIYYYDNDGKLAYTINALGEVTQNSYTPLEQLAKVTRFGTRLSASAMSTLTGGLLTAAATTTLNIANAAVDSSVNYTYADGNLVVEQDADGNYTRYVYGPMNRLQYKLDSTNGLTAYSYDVGGRLAGTTTYAKAVPTASIAMNVSTQLSAATFTSALLASITDSTQDSTTTTLYDPMGRIAYIVSGAGSVVGRKYDANGNLAVETRYATAMTLANVQSGTLTVDAAHDHVCYYGYDTAGNVTYKAESDKLVTNPDYSTTLQFAVTTSQYDANGNVIDRHTYANRISTPSSHTVPAEDAAHDAHQRWIYDGANNVTGTAVATNANGVAGWAVTTFSYDKDSRPTGSTRYYNPLAWASLAGSPSQATVAGAITGAATNTLDRSTATHYDNAGRMDWSQDAAGTKTYYYYDSANRLAVTTVQGLSTRTVYDALGRAVYEIDPLGDVTMNTYDADGNAIAVRRYANPISSANLGNLSATSTVANVAAYVTADNTNDRIERRVYDGENRLVYSIDGLGDTTMYTYDATGRAVSARAYATRINLASYPASPTVASVAGLITTDNANDRVTRNVYDADDRLRYVIDPAGYVTETMYDGLGRVTKSVQYANAVASSTAATLGAVGSAISLNPDDRKITYAYYASGLLQSTTDARNNVESYEYDTLGNKTKFTNKANNVWSYTYDAAGHMLVETDPAVAVNHISISGATPVVQQDASVQLQTTLAYDAFGQLMSRTEASNVADQARTTKYDYDKPGHQTKTTFPLVGVYQKGSISPFSVATYDALGNAVMNLDVGGNYSYKLYDGNGNVLYDVDALGYVTYYQRNAFGEVKAMTRTASAMSVSAGTPPSLAAVQSFMTGGGHGSDRTVTTTYDAAGHVVKVMEPQVKSYDTTHALSNPTQAFTAGRTTNTTYDAFGEVLKQSVDAETTAGVALTVAADTFFTYNLRGQQTAQMTMSDRAAGASSATGYLTTMGYDAFGNVNDRIEYSVAQTFADASFSTKTGMAWSAPSGDTSKRETTYVFDANNNKRQETRKGIAFSTASDGSSTSGDATTMWAFDALDNQIATTDAAGNTTYTYRDALGHVTAVATIPLALKQEQIAQVYIAMLGRAPTAAELNSYALSSMLDIGKTVFGNSTISDSAFITQVYQNLLGRAPDGGGMTTWTQRLQQLGDDAAAHAQVLIEIVSTVQNSNGSPPIGQEAIVMNCVVNAALTGGSLSTAMSTAIRRYQIEQLYVAVAGRNADPAGFAFWQANPGAVDAAMAQSFYTTAVNQGIFPAGTSNTEIATRLYQNIHGHPPDSATQNNLLSTFPADPSTGMGSYIMGLISAVTSGTADYASFVNRTAAGLQEAADWRGTLAPLSEFALDAYGDTIVRTDYANGASYAAIGKYDKIASANDRHTYTQYDADGHAIETVDANGKAAFSEYDAFGRDVHDYRTVTDALNNASTESQTRVYDELGRVKEVDDPGAAHKTVYNAFGEVKSRSVNGDAAFESDDYDNAGHLWRSNAGDGVDKAMLYDASGHMTAQARSAGATYGGANIAGFSSAGDILLNQSTLLTTTFTTDLQGNVLTQTNPAQYASDINSVNGSVVTSTSMTTGFQLALSSVAVTSTASVYTPWWPSEGGGEYGTPTWTGTNTVRLAWSSLAGLGAGDVRVELTCSVNTDATGNNPNIITSVVDQDFQADEALVGKDISWDGLNGKLLSVSRVKILKKDCNGDWKAVLDRTSWDGGSTFARVDSPADPTKAYTFQWRPTGTATWNTINATGQFGDAVLYDLSGLAEGTYDYQVLSNGTAVDTGTTTIVNSQVRTQVAQLYATILRRSPDLGGFSYYVKQVSSGGSLASVAQTLYSSGNITQPTNAGAMVAQFVQNGLGLASVPQDSILNVYMNNWTGALAAVPTSSWGATLVSMIADVANYTGTDAAMLQAQTTLANKVAVGLDYVMNDGGWDITEGTAEMTAVNNGQSVADAEKLGLPALNRRWVARLYVALFDRLPDGATVQQDGTVVQDGGGFKFWTDQLNSGAQTIVGLADYFYNNIGCKSLNVLWHADGSPTTDSEFISGLYTSVAGRAANASDLQYWTDHLAHYSRAQTIIDYLTMLSAYTGTDPAGITSKQLFDNRVAVGLTYAWEVKQGWLDTEKQLYNYSTSASTALASAQAAVGTIQTNYNNVNGSVAPTNTAAASYPVEQARRQVAQLYLAVFNRAPDASGFDHWVDWMMQNSGLANPAATLALSLINGYTSSLTGLTGAAFVNQVFQNAFSTAPTSAQSALYTGQLSTMDKGTVLQNIVQDMVNSTDASTASTRNYFAARVGVGLAYALEMGGGDNQSTTLMTQMVDTTRVTLAGDATLGMAMAAGNIASVAGAAATATANATAAAAPKAAADASLASAQATYLTKQQTDSATPTTANSNNFAQVAQMYWGIVHRSSDVQYTELDYWFQQLRTGASTTGAEADAFLGTSVGQTYYPPSDSNSTFANKVYQWVVGRSADASGLSFWTGQLSQGISRGTVFVGIMNAVAAYTGTAATDQSDNTNRALFVQQVYNILSSDASAASAAGYAYTSDLQKAAAKESADLDWDNSATQLSIQQGSWNTAQANWNALSATVKQDATYYTQLTQLYIGGMGRTSSNILITEVNYWWSQLKTNSTVSIDGSNGTTSVGDFMLATTPGQAMYGSLDNSAFIDKVYLNTVGHLPDAAGKTTWLNQLNTGSTRGQVMWRIISATVGYYAGGGRDPNAMPGASFFINNVSNAIANLNSQAQTAASGNNPYTNWVNQAISVASSRAAGYTAETSANNALNASAAAKNRRLVAQLNTLLLNKMPDLNTFASYGSQLDAGTMTAAQVVSAILASSDGVALYPAGQTDTQFFNTMFAATFGRAPDAVETGWWTTAIRSTTRAQAVVNLISGITGSINADAAGNGAALQSQAAFVDKTQVNLSGISKSLASWSAWLGTVYADAAKVLGPGPGLPAPLDEIHVASTSFTDVTSVIASAQTPRIVNQYDRWGNVTRQTDALNNVTRYTYNANDQVIDAQDALSHHNYAYYDILGRNVATKDANGNINGTVYDALGNVIEQVQADGGTVQSQYDVFGDKVYVRDAAGSVATFGYDALGRLVRMTKAVGVSVNDYTTTPNNGQFPPSGDTLSGAAISETPTIRYGYDEMGRRITVTDAMGVQTINAYDLRGNLASTNASGVWVTTDWDAYNHKQDEIVGAGTADARIEKWTYDAWGHALSHTETARGTATTAGAVHTFTYDGLKNLRTQTSTLGQNLTYTYDAASGLLVKIDDTSTAGSDHVTQYAYDLNGNRTRERTATVNASTGIELDVEQDNHIVFDALNRITDIRDDRTQIHYDYDANGNRTHQHTHYVTDLQAGVATLASSTIPGPTDLDTYNTFDAMNRETLIDGTASGIGWDSTGKKALGVQVGYNQAGQRIWSRTYGAKLLSGASNAAYTEAYFYDAAERLTDTWREGYRIDARYYDADGRLLQSGGVGLGALSSQRLTDAGVSGDTRTDYYDAAGQMLEETVKNLNGQKTIVNYTFDGSGRLGEQYLWVVGVYANDYKFAYQNWNENLQARIDVLRYVGDNKQDTSFTANTLSSYDANGYLQHVVTTNGDGTSSLRDLISDAQGRVLTKTEQLIPGKNWNGQAMANGVTYGVHVSHTLIANGELIGAIGDQNSEDGATYGQNYLPINDRSLTAAPSAYTVQTGDTLQSIAKAMWGDGNLWYAIAEANGYASVTVGQVISIPSRPDVEYNDAQTYKPYDASAIIGDTTPTAPPPPPPKKHHSLLGSILAIIVAVVAVVFTAGAALGALAPELFAEAGALEGMSVMEAGAAFVESGGAIVASTGVDMAAMGAAALAGAAGSAAGQLVNMAAGNQDKFSWNGVAFGALSAGITQGLGGVNLTGGAMNSSANVIARAAIGSALTQGAAVVTGLQSHFDWHGVVGSAVAAGVGQAVGDALGRANINPRVNAFVTGAAHNAATALVRGGKVSFEQIAADAFGNALGQGLVDQASSNYRPSYLAAGEPASDEPFAGGAFRYDTGSVGAKQMGDATFNALKKMMSVPAVTASSSIEEVEGLAGPEYLSQTEVDRENYLLASRSRTITGTSPSGIMTRDGSNYYLITRDANGLGVYQRPEDPMVPTMFTQNTSSPSPSPNATDYSDFFVTRPGRPYRADQIVRQSHYNDPIDTSDGRLAGNSRIWGDAPATTQQASIEALVNSATTAGLTTRQTALVLAIAHTESGFNPDAAAGTTSASGLGQFIDSTGAAYGVNASNRWDVNAQADALVQHFLDNTQLADTRGQGEDYIYKYHHDGPKGNYGGLDLSRKIVIPLANQYELLLQGRR